jgi:RNA-directed DNA polymerase
LQLSPEKTCITHIEQGFDFLGQNTRRYGNRLLTTPSKKNMHAFMEKVRGVIHQNRAAKQENLIRLLNPVIRGWANYHRHIVATPAFRKAEMVLWHSLWRWAKRRHAEKSVVWIAERYWHRLGRRRRTFAVLAGSEAQRSRSVVARLVDPTETPIRRYVKVKSDANPFDPNWREYFEARKRLDRAGSHRG